jgi:hypothetical protein
VGSLQWDPWSGAPGDGSASNAGPAVLLMAGTEANPKKQMRIAAFDASTQEHMWFQFRMPPDYREAPVVKLTWMANAVANRCIWGARISAITPGDVDTPVEHAQAEASTTTTEVNTTEARRELETTITIARDDGVVAGDLVNLCIFREAAAGGDTLTVDAELIEILFSYT